VRQLRGQAEETQVDRDLRLAVTGVGCGPLAMAMLLARD
jgi:hypothetical protein